MIASGSFTPFTASARAPERQFPQAAQMAGDISVKAMHWPDADKRAERLKKALPPHLQDPEDMPPEQQQAAQQQQAQQQAMQQEAAQMARAKAQADTQTAIAKSETAKAQAEEAKADALVARFEAMMKQMELAVARLSPPVVAPMGRIQPPM